ncbi:MAG: FliG C-terminal domain-containing protein [Elusimicrobiota bacterium]|jgi:hypothetical protein
MQEISMFEILELPKDSLQRVLCQAPARTLARLLSAYPRAVSRTFMSVLSESLSRPTINFLLEEVNSSQIPSFTQIRQAESELVKIIKAENLFPSTSQL